MGNLLIRNVPEEIVNRLKSRARKHGRSLQQELIRILNEHTSESQEEILAKIRERRQKWEKENRQFSDSTVLIREDRQR